MIRETFPVGLLGCNCTVLGDELSRQAIIVDPGDDVPGIMARVRRLALNVKQILITHAHIDHIAGAQRLKALTGAPILYHESDLAMVRIMDLQASWLAIETPVVLPPDEGLTDGQTFVVEGISGTVLHTPGHTPGSVCLYLPEHSLLLAGDTLFAGTVGRTDLPGGDAKTLIRSVRDKLMMLPDETTVLPGHGALTSIGREREHNPFL
jgi:glyoxylase-like metal-dependent hydrolase (beta-lactamase superfamily II)